MLNKKAGHNGGTIWGAIGSGQRPELAAPSGERSVVADVDSTGRLLGTSLRSALTKPGVRSAVADGDSTGRHSELPLRGALTVPGVRSAVVDGDSTGRHSGTSVKRVNETGSTLRCCRRGLDR
jgi:hypothetical protein